MEKEKNSTDPLDYMPGKVWEALHPLILGGNDTTRDLSKPHLKQIFVKSYPYIIFLYGILICSGFLSNCFIFCYITKKKLYKDETFSFLLNIALSDMVKCVVVLPLSLYVLLIRNWVLGELLCSFLPMIQDIPQHVSTLTIMILVYDRFRYIRKPHRPRVPAFVCSSGTWLTAVCLVLPYPMYIMYIDFGQIYPTLPAVQGAGMCTVNLLDDIKDYTRGIFVITFATPLIIIACLFIQISRELAKQNPVPAIKFEARARDTKTKLETAQTGSAEVQLEHDRSSQYSRGSFRDPDGGRTLYEFREPYINVIKERRTLKFLISIFLLYVVCLSPLMVLKVGRMSIEETYENMALMDVVYINFVWIAFLPTCTSPVIFLFWQMSSSSVERIRGYFRLSSRKMGHSNETVTTVTGTPASNQSKRYHRSEETLDSNSCHRDSIST